MQAVRKEVCGEANWGTGIKGAEEHAKTTVVIWRYGASIQVHHERQGCREGREGRGGARRPGKKRNRQQRQKRGEEGREETGVGRKNTDVKGSTVWYNLPLSIFSIIISFT